MNKQYETVDSVSPLASVLLLTDTAFLEKLRNQMFKFALIQLSDTHLAEDAVQEALIGALKNAQSFAGHAALKSWVFAILKNKIIDTLRHKQRTINVSSLLPDDDENEDFNALFDTEGAWQADVRPQTWANPEEAIRKGQFWRTFEACLDKLPSSQARVFMMREFIELESDEICDALGITTSNLHVMLHRARLRLRECLEDNWFTNGESPC